MNVYDFDNTIYKGDSTADFYFFCLKRHKSVIKFMPHLFYGFSTFYIFKIGSKTEFKERMYQFLTCVDVETDLPDFWKEHKKNIKSWYGKQQKPDDLVISASPFFLLEPICKELDIKNLIASNVDPYSGKYSGENCYGKEKVLQYRNVFRDTEIEEFYSDSYSDTPLAEIAQKAYMVKGDVITPWKFK